MYTSKNLTAVQAAIASRLGSHIYGYPLFCNTVSGAWLACFHLFGVRRLILRLDENRA